MTPTKITEDTFGTIQDPNTNKSETVRRFTLENGNGVIVQIINYGATITSLKVPSRDGQLSDIVLGFDNISGYLGQQPYFGATIGRVANRIGKGRFSVDGQDYQAPVNNGENSLHGGVKGFDKKLWEAKILQGNQLVFSLLSQDGDQGYPGDLIAQVTYELTADSQLKFDYQAVSTKSTPIVLTNHSYFNLSGHENADKKLEGHFVQLNCDNYTPLDGGLVTTGEIRPVEGSVYDLKSSTDLAGLLKQFPKGPNGYDNNFCVNRNQGESVRLAGRVQDKKSGRVLEVHTDQPGVQFYTANFLPDPEEQGKEPINGKGGAKYWKHGAFCLETQNYPNAVNHKHFPNAILKPGEVYRHAVIYKLFTVQ
ncbi:unnamed protein product [Orchesella dallaii]